MRNIRPLTDFPYVCHTPYNEHGNDFVFYSAVEKDCLIASLWQ